MRKLQFLVEMQLDCYHFPSTTFCSVNLSGSANNPFYWQCVIFMSLHFSNIKCNSNKFEPSYPFNLFRKFQQGCFMVYYICVLKSALFQLNICWILVKGCKRLQKKSQLPINSNRKTLNQTNNQLWGSKWITSETSSYVPNYILQQCLLINIKRWKYGQVWGNWN